MVSELMIERGNPGIERTQASAAHSFMHSSSGLLRSWCCGRFKFCELLPPAKGGRSAM